MFLPNLYKNLLLCLSYDLLHSGELTWLAPYPKDGELLHMLL